MPPAAMRMLVDPASALTVQQASRAYITGFDQIPWPCFSELSGGELVIERSVCDSGRVHVPLSLAGYGELTLSTATLMQRDEPYRLEVELARGKLNQVRNQLAEWQSVGMAISPEIDHKLGEALRQFSKAAVTSGEAAESAPLARQALLLGI